MVGIMAFVVTAAGCAVRRTTRIIPALPPPPALEEPTDHLVARITSRSEAVRTLTATVDLEPTTGSIYSGVIKEYHDVKGFILIEKPATIRMIGQAPVVRTNIFDMVSDGEEFRLYIPPKQKFYVGKNASLRPSKSTLENMRPQHILDALLVPPIDMSREKYSREESEEAGRRYYVLTVLENTGDPELSVKRKVWFDRADLEITRLQLYGPQGALLENVRYANHKDLEGVHYPTRIEIHRPIEDYHLTITILKATFNQPIPPEKFMLKRPADAQLVDLSAASQAEEPRGQ